MAVVRGLLRAPGQVETGRSGHVAYIPAVRSSKRVDFYSVLAAKKRAGTVWLSPGERRGGVEGKIGKVARSGSRRRPGGGWAGLPRAVATDPSAGKPANFAGRERCNPRETGTRIAHVEHCAYLMQIINQITFNQLKFNF